MSRTVDEMWLDTLQRLISRAAHEVKGALNGVSVNLEVVRVRSARPHAPASSVANYAESASAQLEQLAAMAEALLLLSRAPREPVDVSMTLAQLGSLVEPGAKADGIEFCIVRPSGPGMVQPPGNVVRLVLGSALLAALDSRAGTTCATELHDHVVVRLTCADSEEIGRAHV